MACHLLTSYFALGIVTTVIIFFPLKLQLYLPKNKEIIIKVSCNIIIYNSNKVDGFLCYLTKQLMKPMQKVNSKLKVLLSIHIIQMSTIVLLFIMWHPARVISSFCWLVGSWDCLYFANYLIINTKEWIISCLVHNADCGTIGRMPSHGEVLHSCN